jgi:iron complex outermembrane recepter protein
MGDTVMKHHESRLSMAVAAVSALTSAAPLWAQVQIEEVTVTATRREVSAQKVPLSVTNMSELKLELARIDGIKGLGRSIPGLNMNRRSFQLAPYIRGVGAQDTGGGQEANINLYVDGVYWASSNAAFLSFNNIERIEVLKGPQGTLFGRNSSGGLINVITKDPSQDCEVKGKFGYGNYETTSASLYATGGISETLAADIGLNYKNRDKGFGNNIALNERQHGERNFDVRSKWLWTPTEQAKVAFTAEYQKFETVNGNIRSLQPYSISGLGYTRGARLDFQDDETDFPNDGVFENYGGALHVDYAFVAFNFKSITGYHEIKADMDFDNDSTPLTFINVTQHVKVETLTQEFQLQSNEDAPFEWIVGAFYMDDDNGFVDPNGIRLAGAAFAAVGGARDSVHIIKTESIAGFGEATFDLWQGARLTTGIRYTKDKKDLVGFRRDVFWATGVTRPGTLSQRDEGDSWKKPTWRLTLQQEITDDAMVYASYNRGYKAGTISAVTVVPQPAPLTWLDPEIADTYEVGFKSEWLDGRLRLNGAAFFTDYRDLQFVVSVGTVVIVGQGDADIKGFELEGDFAANEYLSFHGGLSVLDTEYTKFAAPVACTRLVPSATRPGFFSTAGGPLAGGTCAASELEGNQLLRAPDMTYNLGMLLEVPVSVGSVGANLDWFWTDKFFWDVDNRLESKAYGTLNGQLFWNSADEKYTVSLYGENLTDKKYTTYEVGQTGIGDTYVPGAPRQYGIEFKFRM